MATTKIWKVENRLDHVMDYTTNEEKTKNDYLEMYKNFDKMLIMDQIWKVFKL